MIQIEKNGNSDFKNLFRTYIYSEIQWTKCAYKETCFEDRFIMELDLPNGAFESTLMQWFEKTFEVVYYNGKENENLCKGWSNITDSTRKEWICKLPKIMIIHLKRFEINKYGIQQRDNKSIDYPIEDLNVDSMVNGYFKKTNPNFKYNLHGVSIHSGTLHGGHYTANIKNMTGDKRWYEWDDMRVWDKEKPLTSGGGPYVLIYHRNDVAIR